MIKEIVNRKMVIEQNKNIRQYRVNKLVEEFTYSPKDIEELEYDVDIDDFEYGNQSWDDGSYSKSISKTVYHIYEVTKEDIVTFLMENDYFDEETLDMLLAMPDQGTQYVLDNYYDDMLDSFFDHDILEYWRDEAEDEAWEEFEPEYYDEPEEHDRFDDEIDGLR